MSSLFPQRECPEGSPIATPPLKPKKKETPKVTFHRKIKSSGYAKLKPYRRIKELQERRRRTTKTKKKKETPYPIKGRFPNTYVYHTKSHNDAILGCNFSPSGKSVLSCSTDGTARITIVGETETRKTFAGHDGTVHTAKWSKDSQYIVTSSEDNTVKLWSVRSRRAQSDALLSIPLDKVRDASFFCVDRFVMASNREGILLYNIYMDSFDTSGDDVKRLRNESRAELVHKFSRPDDSGISTFACANTFISHVVLLSTTQKTICVYDIAYEKIYREFDCEHERSVQTLSLPVPSSGVSHPPSSYDMFLSVAPDDCVRIWDLRTRDCVACLSGGHKNTSSRRGVGAEFSPCLRYVSCGSDAGHGHAIYDIRSGGEILSRSVKKTSRDCKIPVSIAHVSDVSFSPVAPIVASSRHDGNLVFFSRSGRKIKAS